MTLFHPAPAPAGQAANDPSIGALITAKAGQRIAVCIPARDEAETVGPIVDTVERLRACGLVSEVVVVDDGSVDATAGVAESAGATVLPGVLGPGKGQALSAAVGATEAELLVFLDADVTNFVDRYVTALVAPLLVDPRAQLTKASYRRSLRGRADEGGRVTELLARPLLRRFFPDLATLAQPLAGECALRRTALDGLVLADGYGIEIGLLIDLYRRHGRDAIVEVDLGERVHRNRPLHQLRPRTDDVLAAVLNRTHPHAPQTGESR